MNEVLLRQVEQLNLLTATQLKKITVAGSIKSDHAKQVETDIKENQASLVKAYED